MTSPSSARVLFLDFDGVLHPSGGDPGYELPFCWVPELAEDLLFHQDVQLVIHSSWIEEFDLPDMREFLEPLDSRVRGVVGPGPKAQAILAYLSNHQDIQSCLVIDDDVTEFGADFPVPLLVCDPRVGLSDRPTRERLREWLVHGDPQVTNKAT